MNVCSTQRLIKPNIVTSKLLLLCCNVQKCVRQKCKKKIFLLRLDETDQSNEIRTQFGAQSADYRASMRYTNDTATLLSVRNATVC